MTQPDMVMVFDDETCEMVYKPVVKLKLVEPPFERKTQPLQKRKAQPSQKRKCQTLRERDVMDIKKHDLTKAAYNRHLDYAADLTILTAALSGFSIAELKGRARTRDISSVRHALWYVIKQRTLVSYSDIGRRFGRNHTTVIDGVQVAKECVLSNGSSPKWADLRKAIQLIEAAL